MCRTGQIEAAAWRSVSWQHRSTDMRYLASGCKESGLNITVGPETMSQTDLSHPVSNLHIPQANSCAYRRDALPSHCKSNMHGKTDAERPRQ